MADVAVVILHVVAEIRDVAENIRENDRQARRLFERVMAIEPPVLAVQDGTKMSSSESLRQLLTTLEKIRNFLEGYARTTKFNRALKRKANADKFTQLGLILTEGMQALQLDVAVDTWAKEDASDRLEDLEYMVDMMEGMERNRTDNHAEVMGVLKALRNDERAELTGWVEIDYGTDLDFEGSNILGSGAFGAVRTAKWNGVNVAVKQLQVHGVHSDTVRALRKEIRLHSCLRFDHVVQLYAASTISPHLCLVIELASGGSLWNYLHSSSEPLSHALQTAFLYDIARGMSFLHSKGVLHRDLKSANVLVFENRRLKLCDFGLSKIKTESSSRSKRGAVGTAQWMSPEEMDESPANELTDVYSFGIVCFEVATQMQPFKGLKQTQVTRAVADKGKRPQIPEGASASPDVVPLMEQCWKQDPADRPDGFRPVVRALASVVSRVGDPRVRSVTAVDVTPSLGAKAGATATAVCGGGSVDAPSRESDPKEHSTGVDPESISNARSELPSSMFSSGRDVAVLDGAVSQSAIEEEMVPDAERVYAPFADLPIASKSLPPSSGAGSGRIKELTKMCRRNFKTLDKHEEDERLHEPPLADDKMYNSDDLDIAKGLRSQADRLTEQGKYADADPLYLQAIEIQAKILGPEHQDLATTLNNLAALLEIQGKYVEAEPLYGRATAIWEEALGADHPTVATVLNNRAGLLLSQGKYDDAEPLYVRAIAIGEKALGPEHPDLAVWLNNRARLLESQGKYDEAGPLYERSLAIREKVYGPDHPAVATALNNRAELLRTQGKYVEAEPLYERSQAIREKALGPEHPDVAQSLNNRAELLRAQGKYDEADPLYQRALAIDEKVLGPDHPNVATDLNNRARFLESQGKYAEAEPLYARCQAIEEKVLGPEHPSLAITLSNRAGLLYTQGKHSEAEPLYERSQAIREKVLGPEHPDVAASLNNRAGLLESQGKYDDAEPLYVRAIAIGEKTLGPEHPDLAGKHEEAEPLYRRSLAIREKVLGPEHPDVAQSLINRAGLLTKQGKYDEADPLYLRAIEIGEKTRGPDHPALATILNNRARLLKAQGKFSEAEPLYKRTQEIFEKSLGADHPNVATILNNRAVLLYLQENYAEAVPLLERALAIRSNKLRENHPDTISARSNLEAVRKKV